MKIRPINDQLVIAPRESSKQTPGGIALPDRAQDKPRFGEVIAAGHGRQLDSGVRRTMLVKIGDVVAFQAYSGVEVDLEGSKVLVMDEGMVLGVLED